MNEIQGHEIITLRVNESDKVHKNSGKRSLDNVRRYQKVCHFGYESVLIRMKSLKTEERGEQK